MKAICISVFAALLLASPSSGFPQPNTSNNIVTEQIFVESDNVKLDVRILGTGKTLVMLPSLGRGSEDFDPISQQLVKSGFRIVLPQPRGIGKSTGALKDITLHDLGDDVAAVIEKIGGDPVIIVGHALGNRIARIVASDHPELVEKVVLLAAGGMVPIPEEIIIAIQSCFELTLPRDDRLESIKKAFFAEENDSAVWENGWYPSAAYAQRDANRKTPVEEWWGGGKADILVIQALEDAIAPPENARLLVEKYGDRITVSEISGAGHAMLPEKPTVIAEIIIDYVKP